MVPCLRVSTNKCSIYILILIILIIKHAHPFNKYLIPINGGSIYKYKVYGVIKCINYPTYTSGRGGERLQPLMQRSLMQRRTPQLTLLRSIRENDIYNEIEDVISEELGLTKELGEEERGANPLYHIPK